MGLPQLEAFLLRLMNDGEWCRRLLDAPEVILETETELNPAERWAVLEALLDTDDEQGHDFLAMLRTRLAAIGTQIGRPPPDLERVFAVPRGAAGSGQRGTGSGERG